MSKLFPPSEVVRSWPEEEVSAFGDALNEDLADAQALYDESMEDLAVAGNKLEEVKDSNPVLKELGDDTTNEVGGIYQDEKEFVEGKIQECEEKLNEANAIIDETVDHYSEEYDQLTQDLEDLSALSPDSLEVLERNYENINDLILQDKLTVENLEQQLDNLKDKFEDALQNAGEALQSQLEDIGQELEQLQDKIEEALANLGEKYRDMLYEKGMEKCQEMADKAKAMLADAKDKVMKYAEYLAAGLLDQLGLPPETLQLIKDYLDKLAQLIDKDKQLVKELESQAAELLSRNENISEVAAQVSKIRQQKEQLKKDIASNQLVLTNSNHVFSGSGSSAGAASTLIQNYVATGGKLCCSMGIGMSAIAASPGRTVFLNGTPMTNIMDFMPMSNIPSCGMCTSLANPQVAAATAAAWGVLTPQPCIPVIPAPWAVGKPTVLVQGQPALLITDKLQCMWAGTISILP